MGVVECINQRYASYYELKPGINQAVVSVNSFSTDGRGTFDAEWIGSSPITSRDEDARVDRIIRKYGTVGEGNGFGLSTVKKCTDKRIAKSGTLVICGIDCPRKCALYRPKS